MRRRRIKNPPGWGTDRNEIRVCINHNSTHRASFVEHVEIRLPAEFTYKKVNVDTGVSGIYYGI